MLVNLIKALIIFQIIFISGCGKEPKDWKIEYDEIIPGFHGESVSFNKPMVYVLIKTDDSDHTPFQLRIGKKLTAKRTISAYKGKIDLIDVKNDEIFEIVASIWVRKDWWSRIFASDWHLAILKDTNGVESYSMMNIFKLYSNRPEFDIYANNGND